MAEKKVLSNRTDIMKAKMAAAAEDLHDSEAERARTMAAYIERTKKDKETLSLDLLDDAPKTWNYFPALSKEKMLQLKMSIMSMGVLTPIIVWAKEDGRYIILAGHNRVQACREILEEYKGLEHAFDYAHIPAIVYQKDEITEAKAREIIIDTNYIQRSDMSPKLRVETIKARKELLESQKDERGATIGQLMEELNLNRTTVYEDLLIGTKVIPPLQDLYFDGKINRRAVLKFSMYTEDIQDWMYENYPSKLTSARICQLTKKLKRKDEIAAVFEDEDDAIPRVHTQVTVPKNKLKDFRDFCTFYLEDEEFAQMCKDFIHNRTGSN